MFSTLIFYPALIDVSVGCGEEGEMAAQFAMLPESEKFILCLLNWEHAVL